MEEEIKVLENCWVMTTDHVLDDGNIALKLAIKNFIKGYRELEKEVKFNREWNEYYKNEIGERNKLALKLINDKNIQGEKEILKELLKRGSKDIGSVRR